MLALMLTSLLVAVGLCLGLIQLVRRVGLVETVSDMTAMMAMIESAFMLDVVSKEAARRNFQLVADVAQSGVPLFTFNFARRYELLPKVQAVVKELVYK